MKGIVNSSAPDWEVKFIEGCGTESLAGDVDAALQAASTSEYVIVTIGERPYAEMLYPIPTLCVLCVCS